MAEEIRFQKYKWYCNDWIDSELDIFMLDRINANKNIKVLNVCVGHPKGDRYIPEHPRINTPIISFCYHGKNSLSKVEHILKKLPDVTIETTKLRNQKVSCNYFHIKGTSETYPKWWEKVSDILSNLE